MIKRSISSNIDNALARQAAVALIGPRQVGKTTLAHEIAKNQPAIYLDLESPTDRNKLSDPELFLKRHQDKLVILDEIHRVPSLFEPLRGIIDAGRREGYGHGRFLILGSASIELMRQSSESLAGRIEYIDLNPLNLSEVGSDHFESLWLRGGFPNSYLAANDSDSFWMRENFIRTYLERDIPMFGPRIAAETLRRLWTMLAHHQGGLLNASRLAASLGVSAPTITHYVDLLADLLLVRRLTPYLSNVGKRLVKSPKVYIRDSGLTHALLNIATFDALLGHPVAGASWESFVIENLLAVVPNRSHAYFYRTAAGAEIDLLLDLGGNRGLWAIEIKLSPAAKPQRGFYNALDDLKPQRAFLVHSGSDQFPITSDVEAISLFGLMKLIAQRGVDPSGDLMGGVDLEGST